MLSSEQCCRRPDRWVRFVAWQGGLLVRPGGEFDRSRCHRPGIPGYGHHPADVKQQAGDLVSDPRFQTFVSQSVSQGSVTPEARQNLVALVSQKQNVSPEQANQEVSDWQQKSEQAKEQAKTTAANAADSAASGVSRAGLWSFVALLLGAIAASIGGALGTFAESALSYRYVALGRQNSFT